jgi:hypothetical protein
MVALADRHCSIININFETVNTILIIHTQKEVLRFETFETRLEAQDAAIEIMANSPSNVRYKIIDETYFLTLITP